MTSRPDRARVFAPAKINLFLHVGEKRADGYHDLQSLVVFADVGDILQIERGEGLSLRVEGPFASGLDGEADNLVLHAARELAGRAGLAPNARIVLEKNLPVSSGIGGGSSDAAAAVRGLMELWQPDLTAADLHEIASRLGSDVPVCLTPRPAWMEGRGERIEPAPAIPSIAMLLINPGVAVPTGEVFSALGARSGVGARKPERLSPADALIGYLRTARNDLEIPARAHAPIIGTVLDELSALRGNALARMSGSGATCFGLFTDSAACDAAARQMRIRHPGWWVASTAISALPDQ